jgi:hypothetical protein
VFESCCSNPTLSLSLVLTDYDGVLRGHARGAWEQTSGDHVLVKLIHPSSGIRHPLSRLTFLSSLDRSAGRQAAQRLFKGNTLTCSHGFPWLLVHGSASFHNCLSSPHLGGGSVETPAHNTWFASSCSHIQSVPKLSPRCRVHSGVAAPELSSMGQSGWWGR